MAATGMSGLSRMGCQCARRAWLLALLSLWLAGGCASPSPQCERALRPINLPGATPAEVPGARPAAAAGSGRGGRGMELAATRMPSRP